MCSKGNLVNDINVSSYVVFLCVGLSMWIVGSIKWSVYCLGIVCSLGLGGSLTKRCSLMWLPMYCA
jgi:hypothetical protein